MDINFEIFYWATYLTLMVPISVLCAWTFQIHGIIWLFIGLVASFCWYPIARLLWTKHILKKLGEKDE